MLYYIEFTYIVRPALRRTPSGREGSASWGQGPGQERRRRQGPGQGEAGAEGRGAPRPPSPPALCAGCLPPCLCRRSATRRVRFQCLTPLRVTLLGAFVCWRRAASVRVGAACDVQWAVGLPISAAPPDLPTGAAAGWGALAVWIWPDACRRLQRYVILYCSVLLHIYIYIYICYYIIL